MSDSKKILIVGAGPVGLTLAIMLGMQGIECRIIDKRQWTSDSLRAIAISKATEAIFSSINVIDSIMKKSLLVTSMSLNHYSYGSVQLDYLGSKLDNPNYVHIYQPDIESILIDRLKELNIKVDRSCELIDLFNSEEYVKVKLNNGGEFEESSYRYLVGCDGVNSTVRHLADIGCDEVPYNSSFFLADVLASQVDEKPQTCWHVDESGYLSIIPAPYQRVRIIKSFGVGSGGNIDLSPKFLENLIKNKTSKDIKISSIIWEAKSNFRHKVACNGQQGRVFLAGDAYHIFSPIGGVNMNFGLQDANALSLIFKNEQTDQYEKKQRIEINKSLKFTKLLSNMMTDAGKYNRLWKGFFSNFESNSSFKHGVMQRFSGLSNDIY